MYGELIPHGGGAPISLHKATLVVGRDAACDVQLHSDTVSANHCVLEFQEGRWHARDLGSRNGTRVNGCRFEECWLMPNDVLSIAQHRYSVCYSAAGRLATGGSSNQHEDAEYRGLRSKLLGIFRRRSEPVERNDSLGELIPCEGGDPIPLLKSNLLVGRDVRCDIVLDYSTVSGKHCNLTFTDGFWFACDLSSRNGIRVNGVRCRRKWLLPGEILSIAKYRYSIAYTAPSEKPPARDDKAASALSLFADNEREARHDHEIPPEPAQDASVPPRSTGDD